jgi:hypothetical protein
MKVLTNRLAMRLITSFAAGFVALASVADAQTDAYGEPVPVVATSVVELQPFLTAGTDLEVRDPAGTKVRGRLVSIQPPSFGPSARHPLVLPDQPLRAWWSDDPVKNGVTNGFLIGAAAGAFFIGRACIYSVETGQSATACPFLGAAVAGGGGAVVGLIVDSLIHRKELHIDYRPNRGP